jgi:hypothetical protein
MGSMVLYDFFVGTTQGSSENLLDQFMDLHTTQKIAIVGRLTGVASVIAEVQDRFGSGVTIISGWQAGKQDSRFSLGDGFWHSQGEAATIRVNGVPAKEVYEFLDGYMSGWGGLRLGEGAVYFDIRKKPWRSKPVENPLEFYSTERCFNCGFNLKLNTPDWQKQTGCPRCHKSLCD